MQNLAMGSGMYLLSLVCRTCQTPPAPTPSCTVYFFPGVLVVFQNPTAEKQNMAKVSPYEMADSCLHKPPLETFLHVFFFRVPFFPLTPPRFSMSPGYPDDFPVPGPEPGAPRGILLGQVPWTSN